jgi:isopentenyl-diphosphate delta-isomerase
VASDLDPRRRGIDQEPNVQFENRKADHIRLSLASKNEASGGSGLDRIQLLHEALPDLNFSEVQLSTVSLKQKQITPFLISSMTAGHRDSINLNERLAKAAAERGWRMGVGSQRRELNDKKAAQEWKSIRKVAPKVTLYGNLGLAQLIRSQVADVERLVDSLEADGMIIHLNTLQECLQPEGTPNYKGGVKSLEKLCARLSVPVIVKETGCGFSRATLKRLCGLGIASIDVSGFGGTHWGRIEGDRTAADDIRREVAASLANWGISTVDSVINALDVKPDYEVWASGGVRSGVDAAKLLALGAKTIGFAKPILEAALKGEDELHRRMSVLEYELKTVLFCTGSKDIATLQRKKGWTWLAK